MQPGDVEVTYADTTPLKKFSFKQKITLRVDIREFAKCYKDFYMSDK